MNAVIFARGYNITGQVEYCRQYAERKGYTVSGVIVGQGRDLPAVIGGLGTDIDIILVRDMSRLSRNALENYTVQSELEIDYGVLVEVANDRPRDEAAEKFMRNIIAAVKEDAKREQARKEKIFELKMRGIIDIESEF